MEIRVLPASTTLSTHLEMMLPMATCPAVNWAMTLSFVSCAVRWVFWPAESASVPTLSEVSLLVFRTFAPASAASFSPFPAALLTAAAAFWAASSVSDTTLSAALAAAEAVFWAACSAACSTWSRPSWAPLGSVTTPKTTSPSCSRAMVHHLPECSFWYSACLARMDALRSAMDT